MNSKYYLSALLCAAILLSGCQASVKAAPEITEVAEQVSEPEENMIVSAEFAVQRFLAQRPDAIEFDADPDSRFAEKVAFFFQENVSDFRFWSVSTDADTEGNLICGEKNCIYSLDGITADQLLVVRMEFGEVLPIHAISFIDLSGQEQFYYLLLSGEDNVPLLVK